MTSLVLFDIDGTLMRGAGPHHKLALIEGIRKITGLSTTLDGLDTAGMLDRDLLTSMLGAQSYIASETQLAEIVNASQDAYLANSAEDLAPYLCRGVEFFLQQLVASGAVLGLVTGNLSAIGWRKMELAGIRPFFSIGAFAEDGHTRSELAHTAAERARQARLVKEDARISLVGDHANDIAAAKANGFQSVAVATGVLAFEDLLEHKPDILVRYLEELDLQVLL